MDFHRGKGWKASNLRWLGIFFISFSNFSVFYCYDTIQAIQDPLMEQLGLTTSQYGLICSLQYLPSIVMCPLVGFLTTKFTQRKLHLIFLSFLMLGHIGATVSIFYKSFNGLIVSKLIGGLGSDTTLLIAMNMVLLWAKKNESSRSTTLCNVISRTGSILTIFFSPKIFLLENNLTDVFLVGVVILGVNWLVFLVFYYQDAKAGPVINDLEAEEMTEQSFRTTEQSFRLTTTSESGMVDNQITEGVLSYQLENSTNSGISVESTSPETKKQPKKKFTIGFYVLCIYVTFFYMMLWGFYDIENTLFMVLFGWSNNQAGNVLPIYYITYYVGAPFISKILDHSSQFLTGLVVTQFIFIGSFVYLNFVTVQQNYFVSVFPLIVMGIGSVLTNSALYGGLPFTSEGLEGLGIGIIFSLECIGIAISPIIIGYLVDNSATKIEGYNRTIWYFIGILILCLVILVPSGFFRSSLNLKKKEEKLENNPKEDLLPQSLSEENN